MEKCNRCSKDFDYELLVYINEEHPEVYPISACEKCGEELKDEFWTCTADSDYIDRPYHI